MDLVNWLQHIEMINSVLLSKITITALTPCCFYIIQIIKGNWWRLAINVLTLLISIDGVQPVCRFWFDGDDKLSDPTKAWSDIQPSSITLSSVKTTETISYHGKQATLNSNDFLSPFDGAVSNLKMGIVPILGRKLSK